MLSPWLNARKYEWLAPHAIRGATSAKQTAWLKLGGFLTGGLRRASLLPSGHRRSKKARYGLIMRGKPTIGKP